MNPEPDPNCPSTTRHRSLRAHREAGCTCRGESWDAWRAYKAKAAENEKYRRRDTRKTHAFGATAYPNPHSFAGSLERRAFDARRDKACLDEDPTLFDLEGDESNLPNRMQIGAAKAVCAGCKALTQCRELALADQDAWTIRGGMTPLERLRVQRGHVDQAPSGDEADENVAAAFLRAHRCGDALPLWSQLTKADREALCAGVAGREYETPKGEIRPYAAGTVQRLTHANRHAVSAVWGRVVS